MKHKLTIVYYFLPLSASLVWWRQKVWWYFGLNPDSSVCPKHGQSCWWVPPTNRSKCQKVQLPTWRILTIWWRNEKVFHTSPLLRDFIRSQLLRWTCWQRRWALENGSNQDSWNQIVLWSNFMLKSSVDKRGEESRGDQGRAGHDEEGPAGDDQLWGADYDDQLCEEEEERGCDKTRWPENSSMSAHQPCPTWPPGCGSEWDQNGQGKWGRSGAKHWAGSWCSTQATTILTSLYFRWRVILLGLQQEECGLQAPASMIRLLPSFFLSGDNRLDAASECFISTKLSRAREDHLVLWLRHMHPILARQQLAYQVAVVGIIFRINFDKIIKMIVTLSRLPGRSPSVPSVSTLFSKLSCLQHLLGGRTNTIPEKM